MTDSDYDDNKDESPAQPADGSPESETTTVTTTEETTTTTTEVQEDDDDA